MNMSKNYFVTIREIHEFADNLAKESPERVEVETYDFIYSHGCAEGSNIFDSVFFPDCTNYRVEVGLAENGHIVAHAYNRCEIEEFNRELGVMYSKCKSNEITFDDFLEKAINLPEEKFQFDIPLTRGFSDTPERVDTEFTHLDIKCAIDEYIREKEGKQKIYSWMVKGFIHADELGLTEEEFDIFLEETLNK